MKQQLRKVAVFVLYLAVNLTSNSQTPSFDEVDAQKTLVGKIYFSNQPFTTSNAGSKNSFSSSAAKLNQVDKHSLNDHK